MIGAILGSIPGVTKLATGVGSMILKGKEMKHGNKEKREQRKAQKEANALAQFKGEFIKPENWFDSLINGLNRTPRPVIANGTIGLFIYAFIDPEGFSETMTALDLVPPELWWLLSSVVVFYFGARELKYSRDHNVLKSQLAARPVARETSSNAPAGTRDGFVDVIGDDIKELSNLEKYQRRRRNRD